MEPLAVFISYAHVDSSELAHKLKTALEKKGKTVWIDSKSILPTSKWKKEIPEGIEGSIAVIAIISPESMKSQACKEERDYAKAHGKKIIPVLYKNSEEKHEFHDQYIDLTRDDDFENRLSLILNAIDTDLDWKKIHTLIDIRSSKWDEETQRKDNSLLMHGSELRKVENKRRTISPYIKPQLTDLQNQYIVASRRNEVRQRRQWVISSALGLLVLTILAVIAWHQSNNALISQATAIAEAHARATVQVMEEHARATVDAERKRAGDPAELDTRPDLSLLLAAESAKTIHSFSTIDSLLSVLQYEPAPYTFFFGHKNLVTALTFSTNGQQIASASEDHTVRIWNRSTGQMEAEINVGFTATALKFSPDENYLVIGINDTVRVWDIQKSNWTGQFSTQHMEKLTGFAFDSNGGRLAVSYEDGKILLFDFRNKKLILEIDAPSRIDGLAFSMDGSMLAGGYAVNVFIWDVKTGATVKSYYEFGGFAKGLRFTSNNELYAYGSWQGVFQIRNVETGEVIWSLEKPPEWFGIESLSEDGQWLIASGYGNWVGTIILWDTSGSQQMNFRIGKQSSAAKCLSFSPNSQYLVLSGGDQDIQVLDKDSGFHQFTFTSTSTIQCAKFFSNHLILAYDKDNLIHKLDVNSRKEISPSLRISNEILDLNTVDTAENIAAIMTCKQKNKNDRCLTMEIEYYDYVANKLRNSISFETPGENTALSSKGDLLAIANPEPQFNLALWNLSAGIEKGHVLSGPLNWILDIKFSPDGNYLAASSQGDGLIYLWNLASSQTNGAVLIGHDYMAPVLAFSPDGKLLVSGGAARGAAWDVRAARSEYGMLNHIN